MTLPATTSGTATVRHSMHSTTLISARAAEMDRSSRVRASVRMFVSSSAKPHAGLQRPPPGLLALDGLEQGLEVALTEAARAVPLDDLEEQRRPILHRLGEDLQQVPLVVPVHEDAQFGQFLAVLIDLADPLREHVVVTLRHPQKRHVVGP